MSGKESYEERLERKYKAERRYEGSSDYRGAFGLAGVFTLVGVLAVIFWFTDIDFIGLKHWGYYLFIPAFFIWIGGIASYVKQNRLKDEVLAVLESYPSGPIKIDALTQQLVMERPSLLRLLLDLRVERRLKFLIDSKTGDLILGESYTPPAIDTVKAPMTTQDHFFCPQCGQSIDADSTFCPNCGSALR